MAVGSGLMARGPRAVHEDVTFQSQPDHPRMAANLIAMLQDLRTSRADALVKGFPKTLEEYKQHVGVIEGLDLALAIAREAKRKAEA